MKKLINGHKYYFLVECSRKGNLFGFYIKAFSKKGKRYSYINNLNCILSVFDISIEDKKVPESQWIIKEKEANQFFNQAINFLSDKNFSNFLENCLDTDRKLGEWNKIYSSFMQKT